MIAAADLGGSATKLVLLSDGGEVLGTQRAAPERSADALARQVRAFLKTYRADGVTALALTGVGSSFLPANIEGFAAQKVEEFAALRRGALTLYGAQEAVVVSLGTGTSFLHARADGSFRHLGGTGVGGGTLLGLGRSMLGSTSMEELIALSSEGALKKVDWQMGDMALSSVSTLPPELTAANFGKLAPDVTRADLALGLINLVLQTAGSMAMFNAQLLPCDTILFAGALAELPQAAPTWRLFESVYAPAFRSVPHAQFATAIGAAMMIL